MADHYGAGGGLVPSSGAAERPRVHLPVRTPRQPASPPEPVTLTQPRPDLQRTVNEYVETPLRPKSESEKDCPAHLQRTSVFDRTALSLPVNHNNNKNASLNRTAVTKQPGVASSTTFKKDSPVPGTSTGPTQDCSIICRECGKCRCDACRQPRPMPSLWLCDNFCYCSADSCVDYGSCLCCVKGLMYHCATRDGDDDTCADDPCSCGPHRRLGRWTCLGLTSLLLPCLCCYWPLKGVAATCESCYARCTTRGCRCDEHHSSPLSELTPEKRLLDSSPEFWKFPPPPPPPIIV